MSQFSKVALVLGVGPGIGAAVVKKWVNEGFKVACVARTPGKAKAIALSISENAFGYEGDVTNSANLKECISKIENELGNINMLCYNAGSGSWKTYDQVTEEEFENGWKSNTLGLLIATQIICPKMVEVSTGTVIVTGATASLRGKPFTAGFASAKASQRSLTQSLARDLAPKGVHVIYAIIDGQVDTAESLIEKKMNPAHIADTYWAIASQSKSCWTAEIEMRPNLENY